MRTSVVWIVAALGLGLGVGYLLGTSQEPVAPSVDRTEWPSTPADPKRVAAPPPVSEHTHLNSAAETDQPKLELPRGHGVIRGRVALESGDGVGGVLVVATPTGLHGSTPATPGRAPPRERTLPEDLEQAARRVRLEHAGRRRALTDASGRYTLEDLAPGRYRIEAWREHHMIRAARGSKAWGAEPGVEVDFQAEAIVVAFIRVIGVDGGPATTANISTSTDEEDRKGRRRFLWTPERNWVQLTPGEHWVAASAGQDGEQESERRRIALSAGEEAPELVLQLLGQPGIRGRVILPEPLQVPRLQVHALAFDGTAPPDANQALQSRNASRGRYDGRHGTYRVRDIAAGQHLLIVSYDGLRAEHTEVVRVEDRTLEKDLELPPIDPKRYREVRVLDEKSEPVRGAQFSYSISSSKLGMGAGATVVQRQDGSYFVSRWPPQTVPTHALEDPALRVVLRVSVRERADQEVAVDPEAKEELLIRFGAPAVAHLTIDGFAKSGLSPKAVVYVKDVLGETGMGFRGSGNPVSPEGRVILEGLQAGETSIVLKDAAEGGAVQVAVFWLRLEPGENTQTVRLGRLHEVRFEQAGHGVELRRVERGGFWVHQYVRAPGAEGRPMLARFVPAGHYEASSTVNGQEKTVAFDVPAQTVIRFDP